MSDGNNRFSTRWHLAAYLSSSSATSASAAASVMPTSKGSHMQGWQYQHVKVRKKLASGPVGLEALLALPPPDGFLGIPPGGAVA